MHRQKPAAGIAALEIVLVLGVLAAAGLTAWWVYERQPGASQQNTGTTHTTATVDEKNNVGAAPTISSTTDLDTALQTLDQNDPSSDNTDLKTLSSQTDAF